MIDFEIQYGHLKGGQRIPKKHVQKVLKEIEKHTTLPSRLQLSIAFIGPEKIKKLNAEYRGKNAVTDVLSFGFEPQQKGEPLEGEVLICYKRAKEQARQQEHSTRDEVVFLLVHGVLHVLGHDHETSHEAKKMFSLQDKILLSLGVNPEL